MRWIFLLFLLLFAFVGNVFVFEHFSVLRLAFGVATNMVVIALGLSIGAMFVRSMTIHLVKQGTLAEYRYLEHGAFWAIIAWGAIMLLSARFHIPETVTGLVGAVLIGLSLWWSIRHNRRYPDSEIEQAIRAD